MNKYQLYKQIRKELASGCDKELKAVTEILQSGLLSIGGMATTLDVGTPNSLSAMSEAGRIFRDELHEAVGVVLERYRRNILKELIALGLQDACAEAPAVQDNGEAQRSAPFHHHGLTNGALPS